MIIKSELLVENPLVSVVICSFNKSKTISLAIDSVIKQVCDFPFEIIIGDDGSTDNSRTILAEYQKKYPEKIVLLFQKTNLGLGGNWASCVKLSNGKYIANCDDDDTWFTIDKIQQQVNYMEKNPEYGFVHTNYYNIYESTGEIILANPKVDLHPENLMWKLFTGTYPINHGTACFRKDILVPYINDFITNRFPIQDWPTWIIMSKFTKFAYLSNPTYNYFRPAIASMSNPDKYYKIENKYTKEKEMYKYICELFPDDLTYVDDNYDIYMNNILLNLAFKKLDFKSARNFAKILTRLGSKTLKVKCAMNPLSFYLFGLLKKIKTTLAPA